VNTRGGYKTNGDGENEGGGKMGKGSGSVEGRSGKKKKNLRSEDFDGKAT